ncbi:hypothetical protein DPMN_178985 [Dreissena polymorpha]|uniref:Uncharacterized protein n=1 Tax=Dreissena polymorpha TaxID=45954 RepID=A0A9D4EDX6_DREPO|nr:hypothetical protein DPMN_178985 [Dreissena polymorpha]
MTKPKFQEHVTMKTNLSIQKVPGVKNVKDLLNAEFKAPVPPSASKSDINFENTRSRLESISVSDNLNKSQNLLNYEVQKFERNSKKLQNHIVEPKVTLNALEN